MQRAQRIIETDSRIKTRRSSDMSKDEEDPLANFYKFMFSQHGNKSASMTTQVRYNDAGDFTVFHVQRM